MKNKRGIISIVLVVAFMMTVIVPIYGDNKNSQPLGVADIQKAILANNLSLQRLVINVDSATHKYSLAKAEVNTAGRSTIETYKRMKSYYVNEAAMNLEDSKRQLAQAQKNLLIEGEKSYWNLILVREELLLQQGKIDRLQKDKEAVQLKVSVDQALLSDVTAVERTIENETLTLGNLRQKKDAIEMDLNVLMHTALTGEFETLVTDVPEVKVTTDLESAIVKATEKDGDILKLVKTIALANAELAIYDQYGLTTEEKETKLDLAYKASQRELSLLEAKIDLEYTIRSGYNALLNEKDAITIAELKLDDLKQALVVTTKRIVAKVATQADVKVIEEQMKFAELDIKKAVIAYYLDALKFNSQL